MKFIKNFDQFLEDIVNLNSTRVKRAKDGFETIERFLQNNDLFGPLIKEVTEQGSIRQKTIIKPVGEDDEFDVDLLFLMDEKQEWEPKDYLINLHNEFKKSDRYKDLVDRKGKSRCVTIDYADDFHIDIIPSIQLFDTSHIMNKNQNTLEPTDGDGYALWFSDQNKTAGNDNLVKVVKLIKYIRDYKNTFSVKSVLLTTLFGYHADTFYEDLPTALKGLTNNVNNFLQENPEMPEVYNPVLPSENFNRHWNQEKYNNFREKFNGLTQKINTAYGLLDEEESIEKWKEIFGDDFPANTKKEIIETFKEPQVREASEEFIEDLGYSKISTSYILVIDAKVVQDGWPPFLLRMTKNFLRKKRSLTFFIDKQRSNIPDEAIIYWKVKNKGHEAAQKEQLRGEITRDSGNWSRSESTAYTGTHYVECYAILDNKCIAFDRIDVPIGII